MKKLLLLALAAIAMLSFNSCSKDDDGKKDDPKPKEMRYVKSVTGDGGLVFSYEYDNQHRLTKFTAQTDYTDTYSYAYNESAVTVTKGSDQVVLQLNSSGYVTSAKGTMDGNSLDAQFTYDANGHLLSGDGITYTWLNGNLISQSADIYVFTYGASITPSTNIDLSGIYTESLDWEFYDTFIGKHSINLLIKETDAHTTVDYTYTFDSEGYITKIISKPSSGSSATYQVSYY